MAVNEPSCITIQKPMIRLDQTRTFTIQYFCPVAVNALSSRAHYSKQLCNIGQAPAE